MTDLIGKPATFPKFILRMESEACAESDKFRVLTSLRDRKKAKIVKIIAVRNGRIYLYPCAPATFTKGTWDDLREAGITPVEGLRLNFYDDDADEHGRFDALPF